VILARPANNLPGQGSRECPTRLCALPARVIFLKIKVLEQELQQAHRNQQQLVHRLYFEPQYEEFSPRTMWSLSNAFTSAFKISTRFPQFKATAKLGAFLAQLPNFAYTVSHFGFTPFRSPLVEYSFTKV
jgi:hypothetical protein